MEWIRIHKNKKKGILYKFLIQNTTSIGMREPQNRLRAVFFRKLKKNHGFIQSSMAGHCGCLHAVATVNNAATNTGVPISL